MWRALALYTAGRAGEAVALLRERIDAQALDAPLQRAAIRLLRGRPELAPLLQDALGPGYLQLFTATWGPLLADDLRRPTTLRALLQHPPRLDLPPTEAPLAKEILHLRVARAAAFAQLGQSARAAHELAQIDLTQAAATHETRAPLRAALPRLAALELADGHPDAAFAHLHMLAQLCDPEVFADLVSADAPARSTRRPWPTGGPSAATSSSRPSPSRSPAARARTSASALRPGAGMNFSQPGGPGRSPRSRRPLRLMPT